MSKRDDPRQQFAFDGDADPSSASDAERQEYFRQELSVELEHWRTAFSRNLKTIVSPGTLRDLHRMSLTAENPDDLTRKVVQHAGALNKNEMKAVLETMVREEIFMRSVADDEIPKLLEQATRSKKILCGAAGAVFLILWAVTPVVGTGVWGYPLVKTGGAFRRMLREGKMPEIIQEALDQRATEQQNRPGLAAA